MIIGTYPCCGADLMIPLPDAQLPRFGKHECEECGESIWTWFTRLNPQSWTEREFEKVFEVNHESKSIKLRPGMEDDTLDEFYEIARALGLSDA